MATKIPFWQPATLYQPEEIVQSNKTPNLNVEQPTNQNFDLGDQDWTKDPEFTIDSAGQTFNGAFRAVFAGNSSPGQLGIPATAGVPDKRVYITPDGTTTPFTSTALAAQQIAGSGSVFIAIDQSAAFSSVDGVVWTVRTPTWGAVDMDLVDWDPFTSLFYVFERNSTDYHTSPDGITWTARTFPAAIVSGSAVQIRQNMANNGQLTLVTDAGNAKIYSTTDGISWTLRHTDPSPAFLMAGLEYSTSLGRFVYLMAGSRTTWESTDGIAWNQLNSDLVQKGFSSEGGASLAWSETAGLFVASRNTLAAGGAATTDKTATSPDGTTWTLRNSFDTRFVRWSDAVNKFVALVGNVPDINTSSDGISWAKTNFDGATSTLLLNPSTDMVPASAQFIMTNDQMSTVFAGQAITAQVQVLSNTNSSGRIGIAFFDTGMSLISTTFGPVLEDASTNFRLASVSGVAPSGAVSASVVLAGAGLNEVLFDAVSWDYAFQAPKTGLLFKAVQVAAGFSGSVEPTFDPVLGNTVVDNEVTWETIEANCIIWKTFPILKSGATEPTFPTEVGASVVDNTILWVAESQRVQDTNCPNTPEVAIAASKIFAGDDDIVAFSATINPLDWTTAEDAGYIPFGLNTYGSDPVSALGLYRSNLVIFNAKAFQMWQVDEDPNNFAILDAVPVGCRFRRSLSPVSNDLVFLTDEGIRSIGIAGASTNLQAGFFGKQVDPLVLEAIKGGEVPDALFFPGAGQYWLFFGEEAFVLTMNGGKSDMSWSRYVFPSAVDDWALQDGTLYLRSGDKVWKIDDDTLVDDFGGSDVEIIGNVTWPYLDFGALGVTKQLIGFDVVADGEYTVSIGYDQKRTTLATTPYLIDGDTLPGDVIPLPIAAPSMQLRLIFTGNGDNDPDFDSVVLLLSFDGDDGDTTTVDESNSANVLTFVGDAQIQTGQSQFGGSSLGVNNSTLPDTVDDTVTFAATSDFDFADDDWTVELFYRADESAGSNGLFAIGDNQSGGGDEMLRINLINGNIHVQWTSIAPVTAQQTFDVPHTDNVWHHLVVQRRTDTLQVWFDGTESTTGPVAITVELTAAAVTGTIGASAATTSVTQEFQGYIDEVRVTKGVARFTEDFTIPTAEYPAKGNIAWEWSAATLYLQDFRRSS